MDSHSLMQIKRELCWLKFSSPSLLGFRSKYLDLT
jgi:hypothetical protein